MKLASIPQSRNVMANKAVRMGTAYANSLCRQFFRTVSWGKDIGSHFEPGLFFWLKNLPPHKHNPALLSESIIRLEEPPEFQHCGQPA